MLTNWRYNRAIRCCDFLPRYPPRLHILPENTIQKLSSTPSLFCRRLDLVSMCTLHRSDTLAMKVRWYSDAVFQFFHHAGRGSSSPNQLGSTGHSHRVIHMNCLPQTLCDAPTPGALSLHSDSSLGSCLRVPFRSFGRVVPVASLGSWKR